MTGYRLKTGGAIDRARPIAFSFDGARLPSFAGDTLASALLARSMPDVGSERRATTEHLSVTSVLVAHRRTLL